MKKILACILMILLTSPYAFCAEVGRVTYVEGRVDVAKADSELAVPVREGDGISAGDAIRTKAGSKAEVRFDDGSTMRLAQNSRVEIKDYTLDNNKRKTATIKLDRGKVRTIIAKTANSAPFNILTPNAEGTVKGSDIFTFYQAGSSGMLVAEGNLALKSIALPEKSLSIPAGNSAFVDVAGAASGPRPYLELEKKMHEQDTYVPPTAPKKTEAAAIKGVFAKISGVVKITPKEATTPREANINDILGEGDQIETGPNGMVEIKFDNGCGLNLKPNTQIKITRLVIDPKTGEYQNLFESSKGKIKARIENLKGKSSFEIKTPTAICGARGTFMYIEITPAMTRAFFEGGNGYINNLISGAQTDIGMGDNGSADDQGNNSDPAPTSNEERDNWTAGWDSGNDTSGYSSGDNDANDNLGDTGDNQGGNNANNDNGTGDDNGNTDLYIPPEPAPNPNNPVEPTLLNLPAVFGATNASLYGEVDSWENPVPFAILGDYLNPGNYKLWSIDGLSGSIIDNDGETGETSLFGWSAGIKQGDTLMGLLYAFYIRPNGTLGYVKCSDVSGNFSQISDYGILSAIGSMNVGLSIPSELSPEDLISLIQSGGLYSGKVGGDISGMLNGESFQLGDQNIGDIFKETLSGTYASIPGDDWQAVTGGSIDDDEGHYIIMHISGDTAWSGGKFRGTITGRDIGYSGNGHGWMGSPFEGDAIGVYYETTSQWEAQALGYAPIADLAFGGKTTHENGVDYALFGGIQSPWAGPADILFMGDYSAQEAPSRELWKFHTLGATPDGASIYGMAGGTKLNNVLKGLMYAIYIKTNPDYNPDDPDSRPYLTGYLESTDISGNVYPDLGAAGMFEADGSVTATEMGETSIRPDQLNEESGFLKREAITGKVGGDLVGNLLNAHDESESVTLEDNVIYQNWAVFRIEASGTYQNAPSGTGWTAVAGDHDNYDDGREGYWIAHLTGADWSDGQFSGTMAGRDLTYDSELFQHDSSTGTFSGKYKGTYGSEDNSWSMVGLGFSDAETPLAFGGDTTHESGVNYALFGGTQSLWAGSPDTSHDILFMGDYSAQGAPQRDLWRFHTLGATSDNAAIYGMAGGTKLNNVLKGLMYAIYIRLDPDNEGQYLAGYLKSTDISGNVYPDLGDTGMFEADGNVTATQMGQTAVSSSQLLSYMQNDTWNDRNAVIYRDEFSGKVGGDIAGDFSGESIGIDYSLTDQMWSIWRTEASGTYSPEPQGAWHAVIGGSDTESGDKGYFIGHIDGPAWSGSEFNGNITGKEIWYSSSNFDISTLGTMTGQTLGTYADGDWEAINAGVTNEVSLAFGGILEGNDGAGNFAHYNAELKRTVWDETSHITGLLGGTDSLWTTASPEVTIIGEFANSSNYKLWGVDIAGKADRAAFLGIVGGTKLKDVLKGLLYAFYIRENPEYNSAEPISSTNSQYLAGYIKSADISGYFYPGIRAGALPYEGMFETAPDHPGSLSLNGCLDGEQPTDILPGNLFLNIDSEDDVTSGLVRGDISGAMDFKHPSIVGQNWGLWKASLGGGAFTKDPADGWSAVAGGRDDDDTGYWLMNINDSGSGNGLLSATVSGVALDEEFLRTLSDGELRGVYDAGNQWWEALAAGAYTETPLKFVSYISDNSVSLEGLFGSIVPPSWSGEPTPFTFIGSCSLPSDGKHHMWGTDLRSYNYHSSTYTTYDGGAYRGSIGGVFKDNNMDNGFVALYVDSEGNAGTIFNLEGSTTGTMYPEIGMFKANGTLQATQKASLDITTINPEDYLKNISNGGYLEELNLRGAGLEPISGGTISGSITKLDSTVFNISGERWGIWSATIKDGLYTGSMPDSWRLGLGGEAYFTDTENIASYWLGTLDVSKAADGKLTGNYKGLLFSEADDPNFIKVQTVSGSTKGYVEAGETNGTWQAGGAGEWVEVTDLLTEYGMFGPGGLSQLNDFVSIPITEAYSVTNAAVNGNFNGGVGSITGTMGVSFYTNANLTNNGIWAATVAGGYAGMPSEVSSWTANITGSTGTNPISAVITGAQWSGNQWVGNVNSSEGSAINFNGQVGGTYTPADSASGTFSGVGAGTWNTPTEI